MGIHMEIRELIFRGFHPCDGPDTIVVDGEEVKGRWVEGSLVYVPNEADFMCGAYIMPRLNSAQLDPERKSCMLGGFFEVLPSTVGQYTNMNCFGTKIFEHDIIEVENEQGEVYRFCVVFGECGGIQNVKHKVGYMGFHFEAWNEEAKVCMKYGARDDILYWLNSYNCEVISTVFDEVMP